MAASFNQSFTKLENWQFHRFNPQVGITDVVNHAYIIQLIGADRSKDVNLEEFHALLQDPQVSHLQALVCQIDYDRWNDDTSFGVVLEALCDAHKNIPNLKALFVGDGEQHEYRKSKLHVFDIRPILEAYPNLQVLQVRGRFDEYELECKSLRHENLKTLILETADLNNQNLCQIGSLELPKLEYFELWLGRQLWDAQHTIDSLLPILSGKSFPNLMCLGLRSSEYADQIASAVVQSHIIEGLVALDFSMGNLTNEGVEALLNCPAINKLYTLNVSMNDLSTSIIQKLSQLNCQVIAEPQDGKYGDRYSALYE